MLVLTRKAKQEILIGNDIRITVVELHGNRVRIGVTAPKQVPVLRAEVLERVGFDLDLVLTETTDCEPLQEIGVDGGRGDHLAVAQAHVPNSPVLADVPSATRGLVVPETA